MGSGLRKGEVLGLTWDNIDLDAGELSIGRQLQRVSRQLLHREKARLAGPLKDLPELAEALADPGETCPVCATAGVPWVSRLGTAVTGLVAIGAEDEVFRKRLAELRRVLDTDLDQVIGVLRQDWCDAATSAAAKPVIERCSELRQVLDHDGQQATPKAGTAPSTVGQDSPPPALGRHPATTTSTSPSGPYVYFRCEKWERGVTGTDHAHPTHI